MTIPCPAPHVRKLARRQRLASILQVDLRAGLRDTAPEWRKNLQAVLDRGQFILGEELLAFEAEFATALGARCAIGTGSGTSALELCLRDLPIAPGQRDVLTSALTAPFTAVAIQAAGYAPRFADIDPLTLQIDPGDAAQRITKRTRAIIPVHLYGQPCELDLFVKLARLNAVALVQDACQAHGARYRGKPLTVYSRYVAYSFYPTKNLGALGDGGAILTDHPATAKRLRSMRDGGRQGDQVSHTVGINSRLDEIQCCFLRAFLPHLEDWNRRRARIADIYDEELRNCPGVTLITRSADSVHHLYVIRAERRDRLREHLTQAGIGTAIHYPVPLHKHPAFAQKIKLPHAERACEEILSLPVGPYLRESAVRRVAARIRCFYR